MAYKIKILIMDSLYTFISGFVILHIIEFIKPGIVSNHFDLNRAFIFLWIYIIIAVIISQFIKNKQ